MASKRGLEDQSSTTSAAKRRKASSTANISREVAATTTGEASTERQLAKTTTVPKPKAQSRTSEVPQHGPTTHSQTQSHISGQSNVSQSAKEEVDQGNMVKLPTKESSLTISERQQRTLKKRARRKVRKEKLDDKSLEGSTNGINASGWQLTSATAGRYLDQDPIFVLDEHGEECLVAATSCEVQLLSLETSLVLRTHAVPEGRTITSFAKSPYHSQSIEVACDDGSRNAWDWVTSAVSQGTFPSQDVAMSMSLAVLPDGKGELYYIARTGSMWSIFGERRALYTTRRWLKTIQVLHNGAYIVCLSTTAIVIGTRQEPGPQSEYVWSEIPAHVALCCVAVKLTHRKQSKKSHSRQPALTLAVGNADGQIHLYNDLHNIFASPPSTPTPRVLHWHREAVSTLKFSADGNYIISGGKETVLVLWQLDTGKQQFLPHLTAEIERVVVSPEGTRYALQMGDNSIMILSTSELKPVAYFAGLQFPVLTEALAAADVIFPRPAMILHPQDPFQLILSVPATQPKRASDVGTRPFLQTYDMRNSRHISRQALTRNNVTDLNLGPEQTPIVPPDVSQVAISADGKWLATIDEWDQPGTEFEHAMRRIKGLDAEDVHYLREQQDAKREIHLKFWRMDETQKQWTLSTRVDAPHQWSTIEGHSARPGIVLQLVADPVSTSFVTIGEDSRIKIWRPKPRTRHGITLKEADGTDAIDWTCKHTVSLPAQLSIRADSPIEDRQESKDSVTDAALAFSPDGSILACAQASSDGMAAELVHFVSMSSGTIVSSKAGLIHPEQEVLSMAFLDRYFISLTTKSVRVWDLVENKHVQTRAFAGDSDTQDAPMLAVNHLDGTFAVALSDTENSNALSNEAMQVFDPKQPHALFTTSLPSKPAALLAGTGLKGYTIVFVDGTIRQLSPAKSTSPVTVLPGNQLSIESKPQPVVEQTREHSAEGSRLQLSNSFNLQPGEYSTTASGTSEDDRPVVRPEQLASIFEEGHSFALPPVHEMFATVVQLFSRKPQHRLNVDATKLVKIEA